MTDEFKKDRLEKLEVDDELRLFWRSGEMSRFSFIWLRDNARDAESFDARSHQRRVYTADLDPGIEPEWAHRQNTDVCIKWPDMPDEVSYPLSFLHHYGTDRPSGRGVVETWRADLAAPRMDFSTLSDRQDLLLESIRRYGMTIVSDCPQEPAAVTEIAEALGYVRQTIFGGVWSFEADAARDDSAYSTEGLRPHTDGTFSFDPPGIQILLCVENEASGAESILVDGYHVSAALSHDHPDVFQDLCEIPITGIYKGDGVLLRADHPVFRMKEGRVCQVCFNNYDRDIMRLPDDEMRRLYQGIRVVDRQFNDRANQWRYTLAAGEALVFDNWRVLHGRTAYSGKRKMAGTYVNREDLESRYLTRLDHA